MGDQSESAIVARCACGIGFTLAQWANLDLAGVQDDGDSVLLEMRNCSCGSTRARIVDFRAAVRLLNDETKKLRRALSRLRDIDRATVGLSQEISELDRGIVRSAASIGDVGERARCIRIVKQTLSTLKPATSTGQEAWIATLGEVLEARLKID